MFGQHVSLVGFINKFFYVIGLSKCDDVLLIVNDADESIKLHNWLGHAG